MLFNRRHSAASSRRTGYIASFSTRPEAIPRLPATMGFGPGCHEVRTGSAYVACPGCDGLVKLATCSHMRSIAQHDVPTSARHVYGNLRDKWTCQARLNAFGATLSPWHDKLTFATSQQTFRRRLCFRSMCKWTPDFQALPVLPLAIIRPPCIVLWIVDRVPA